MCLKMKEFPHCDAMFYYCETFIDDVCSQIKSFWTFLWLTVTSRCSPSSSPSSVHICRSFLLWSSAYFPFHGCSTCLFLYCLLYLSIYLCFLWMHVSSLDSPYQVQTSLSPDLSLQRMFSLFCPFLLLFDLCCIFDAFCLFIEEKKKALLSFESLFVFLYCDDLPAFYQYGGWRKCL